MLNRREVELYVQKFAGNLGHDGLDRLWLSLSDGRQVRWEEVERISDIVGASWAPIDPVPIDPVPIDPVPQLSPWATVAREEETESDDLSDEAKKLESDEEDDF